MSEHLRAWWQSLVAVGAPIFPYVGLILLLLLGLLALVVLLYVLYKFAKRLPPILRYSFWRVSTLMKRLLLLKPQLRAQQLSATFAGNHQVMPFDASFGKRFGVWGSRRRPAVPLFVVLGATGSGSTSLLNLASGRESAGVMSDSAAAQSDVVWWQLNGRLALEVHPHLHEPSAYTQRMRLLQLLDRFSPAQPLDGIVVTLSAKLLLEKGDLQRKELAQLGRIVTEFSGASETRLPVYLVINGSECLPGFSGMVQATGGRGPENELHWLGTGAATTSDVEDALTMWFQSVETEVLRSVVKAPPREGIGDSSSILALPGQVAQLRQPLQEWLRGIMVTAAPNRGSSVFCGVLLTGLTQSEGEGAQGSLWGLRSLAPNLNFAKALSSQPTVQYALRMRRRVGGALISLLSSLLILGLWTPRTLSAIREDVKTLRTVIDGANFQLEQSGASGAPAGYLDPHRLDRLLNAIAVTSNTSLRAALVPSSWLDSSRSLLLSALGGSVQKLLIEPRIEALAQDRANLPADAFLAVRAVPAERINALPAYVVLQEFLGRRELVGSAKDAAESLAGGITYQDMVRFLGDDPDRFKAPVWGKLSTLPAEVVARFDVTGLRHAGLADQDIKPLIDGLWERVLEESLDLHPAAVLTQEISALMDRLARAPTWSYDDAVGLGDRLKRLQQEVERPQASRLLGTMPESLRFFSPAFVRLSSSSIVPMSQHTGMSTELGKRREAVRARLLSYEPDGIGRVFVLDAANDRLKVSPEMKRFSASYALLMAQPFMKPAAISSMAGGQADRALSWNLAQLESVKELSAALRDYTGTGIQAFDPVLRSNLLRASKYQFHRTLDSVVLQAARPPDRTDRGSASDEPLIALRAQAENLASAARLYKLAISPDDDAVLGLGGELLASQLLRVLNSLESRLLSENPYDPIVVDTLRWILSATENRPLASVMRGSPKERMTLARDYVRTQYGTAVAILLQGLTGLAPGSTRDEMVQRWRRLADTLDAFDKGASANGLYELEQYVLNLAKLGEPDDCVRFLAERAPVLWRSDYFSARLAQLDEKIVEACAQRTINSKQKNYLIFAKWFNSQIAGHAPFSDDRRLTPLNRRSFMEVLARYRDMRKQLATVPPKWPQPIMQFLAQMDGLSTRFSSLESGKAISAGAASSSSAGVLQAKLQFRANGSEAVLADQIIDWSVVSGERLYGLRNTKDLFEWRIGESMAVRLRWAANSPYTPVASKNGADVHTVDGRSVVFHFSGEWAFFDILRKHGDRGDGIEKVMLRFNVPVVGPEGRADAQVYFSLTAPDDQASLGLTFPAQAPLYPDESTADPVPLNLLNSRS